MNKFAQASGCRGVILLCWLLVSGLAHAETTNVAGALVKESNPGLQPHGANWRLDKAAITNTNLPRVLLVGDSITHYLEEMKVKGSGGEVVNLGLVDNPNVATETRQVSFR